MEEQFDVKILKQIGSELTENYMISKVTKHSINKGDAFVFHVKLNKPFTLH